MGELTIQLTSSCGTTIAAIDLPRILRMGSLVFIAFLFFNMFLVDCPQTCLDCINPVVVVFFRVGLNEAPSELLGRGV